MNRDDFDKRFDKTRSDFDKENAYTIFIARITVASSIIMTLIFTLFLCLGSVYLLKLITGS